MNIFYRRYVPELKKMPLKYLFQPWKAPKDIQEKAGCVIGTDYPEPMVNHKEASTKCKRMMEDVKCIIKDPSMCNLLFIGFKNCSINLILKQPKSGCSCF